ncbi:hypothetical protein [Streptomyces sp. G1]|uniref:hypothetical protein n=1 Tax=Streptomyces sp. G1 TaxID=361572 RepID=UPI00202FD113|nr:hypothetical protein [Streptomyces sp. G1]MCM1967998.1 hypothetical protein [Streptomyces sp. G1]
MLSEEIQSSRATHPHSALAGDPVLRLQSEMQRPGEVHLQATTHPEEISITGIPVRCARCGARRDWMIICDRNRVSIRCRCSHQWVERELNRVDFDSMIDAGGQNYPDLAAAAAAIGYDGTLAGTYLNDPRPQ